MTVDTSSRKIILFSGGFDSTLVLARIIKEAKDGETVYAVTFDHNLTGTMKLRREYESQLLILRELRKQFPAIKIHHEVIRIESNWISGDASNNRGPAQSILWSCNLIPLLDDNDTIYFGYNQEDQDTLHLENIDTLVSTACKIQEGKKIYTRYPLKYFRKTEVLSFLIEEFPNLVELCTSCEAIRYEGEKVCGECVPCTHIKEALLHLALKNDKVGESAKQYLSSWFGIEITVKYTSSKSNEIDDNNYCAEEPAEE